MSAAPEFTDEVAVARLADIPPGSAKRFEVHDVEVAVVHSEGQIFAIDDICSHGEVSLSEGEVDGCFIECWLHGSRFDLRTGEPTSPPATVPVPVYQARVVGEGPEAVIYVSVSKGAGHTWQS